MIKTGDLSLNVNGASVSDDSDNCSDGECRYLTTDRRQRSSGEHTGSTLQDLSNMVEQYEDEDDEDSDWEPVMRMTCEKWFCVNCTMANFEDGSHCEVRLISICIF